MECALVSKPADGPQWVYEIKLDGYRAVAVNSEGKVTLFSKKAKEFGTDALQAASEGVPPIA